MEPIGVASLTRLFSNCIECFHLAQQGRYLGRDYHILETKFMNQRLRLLAWGRACGLAPQNITPPKVANITWTEDARIAVSDTLTRISCLFEERRKLHEVYGLRVMGDCIRGRRRSSASKALEPIVNLALKLQSHAAHSGVGNFAANFLSSGKHPGTDVKTPMRWVISDKAKFAELIQHLKDFIDDLENLTSPFNVSQLQRELIRAEMDSINDTDELAIIEEAHIGTSDPVADAATLRLAQIQASAKVGPTPELTITDYDVKDPQPPPYDPPSPQDDEPDWYLITPPSSAKSSSVQTWFSHQELHRVICETRSARIFLDPPTYYSVGPRESTQWLFIDQDSPLKNPEALHLSGCRPLKNLKGYLAQNSQLFFLVFREYTCSHEFGTFREVVPSEPKIYIASEALAKELKKLMGEFWKRDAGMWPDFAVGMELSWPYEWYLYNWERIRAHLANMTRPVTEVEAATETLLKIVEKHSRGLFQSLESLKSTITWSLLPFIFAPGELVVQLSPNNDNDIAVFQQSGIPRVIQTTDEPSEEVLEIPVKRHKHDWYCGDQSTSEFHLRIPRSLFGDKSREKGGIPVAISSLQVVPLSLAKDCDPEYLIQRGKKVEELTRGLGLVVYTDPHQDSLNGEYILDLNLYTQQTSLSPQTPKWTPPSKPQHLSPNSSSSSLSQQSDALRKRIRALYRIPPSVDKDRQLDNKTLQCMPYALPGFSLRDHVWRKLLVRNMQPKQWPDAEIEELLVGNEAVGSLKRLLTPWEKESVRSWCQGTNESEEGCQTRVVIGLDGGNIEAALSIASRVTKRGMYRIQLSRWAGELEAVFSKAKVHNLRWGCIFVIEDILEALVAQPDVTAREKQVIKPVVQFLDTFSGIAILKMPGASRLKSEPRHKVLAQQLIEIESRLCSFLSLLQTESLPAVRYELWACGIQQRLNPQCGFTANQAPARLKTLSQYDLRWKTIQSIIQAVVPMGSEPEKIKWAQLEELCKQHTALSMRGP